MSWRSKRIEVEPAGDDAGPADKLAELTHREVALRRITEAVEQQRTQLEERERALASSASAAAAAGEERLAEAIRRAEQSEQRVRELEQHVSELEARPAPHAEPAPVAAIEEPPAPATRPLVLDLDGEPTYTLQRLERLVREAELRGDPKAEEWAYYLPLLREEAEPDGRLPAQFASLVDSIFAREA